MMTEQEQIKIMKAQLECFPILIEKMMYLTDFFGNDPAFSKRAVDIVRGDISKNLAIDNQKWQ